MATLCNLPPPQTVVHQLITVKECQSQCIHKLGELRFDKTEDFLGSYFHYLQYGYHMGQSAPHVWVVLTPGVHAQRGLQYLVCVCVCVTTILLPQATKWPKSNTNGFGAMYVCRHELKKG